MTTFKEFHNGTGLFTADENNNRNAERGTFVRNGGQLTVGASTTDPVVNVAACDFRIAETDYSLADGTVTLTGNATGYPRRDLVVARIDTSVSPPQPSFGSIAGDVIDGDTLARLQNPDQPGGARLDDQGLPIYAVEAIPQIQPPDATGLRETATVLGMVFLPPGTAASSDLADAYLTDLRKAGIGVDGVLRTGDALREVENSPDAVAIDVSGTAANADALAGVGAADYQRTRPISGMRLDQASPPDNQINFEIPEIAGATDAVAGYHAQVAGIGNFGAHTDVFHIAGDWTVKSVGGNVGWSTNTITAIGPISGVNLRVTGTPNLQISFNSTETYANEGNIRGTLEVLRGG